jgi:hypothetical protein
MRLECCAGLSASLKKKNTGVLQEAKFKKYRNFTGIFAVLQGQIVLKMHVPTITANVQFIEHTAYNA